MVDHKLFERIQKSIDYIEEMIYEPILLEEVAKSAYMSLSSFYIVFQSLMGTTLKDYVRKRRLSLSAFALVHTQKSVLEIAIAHQYNGYEAYSRAFKKLFNLSPKNYRDAGIFTNVFPKLTIINQRLNGGSYMDQHEMNMNEVAKTLETLENGYLLDIDIDHFDAINKNYGYDIGDKVLVEVPTRTNFVLRKYNLRVEVIRIGNDEYVVILKNMEKSLAVEISKEIIQVMQQKFVFGDTTLEITVSVGIAEFSTAFKQEAIIKNVKDAMFQAKKSGRNQYHVSDLV